MPYSTRQAQAILRQLERRSSETLTAPELAEALRQEGCPVGLATVYRQLEKLAERGSVHKVATETGACYQYCGRQGSGGCFLLRCQACGRLEHLDCPRLQDFFHHLAADHAFRVNPRRTVLTGLCAACGGKEADYGEQ